MAGSQFAWWMLSKKQKKALRLKRASGDFGGESAKAVSKAPYFWAQEHGEPKAAITGQGFVREAFENWKNRAGGILRAHLRG